MMVCVHCGKTQQFLLLDSCSDLFSFLNKTTIKNTQLNLVCPYSENFSHWKDSFEYYISITKKLELPVLEDRVNVQKKSLREEIKSIVPYSKNK